MEGDRETEETDLPIFVATRIVRQTRATPSPRQMDSVLPLPMDPPVFIPFWEESTNIAECRNKHVARYETYLYNDV